jgi:hypothetical protein
MQSGRRTRSQKAISSQAMELMPTPIQGKTQARFAFQEVIVREKASSKEPYLPLKKDPGRRPNPFCVPG